MGTVLLKKRINFGFETPLFGFPSNVRVERKSGSFVLSMFL